jgi:hypothetical protein
MTEGKKMRANKMKMVGLLGILAVMGSVSCVGESDIDRTQANRLPKSLFQGTWYMRSVVVDVPGTSAASFIGSTGTMEKIRWEIQEQYLIAHRAYEEIPNASRATAPNQTRGAAFKENPIAVFPIKSHFDVKREYNAATGEQTNVIVENTTDRPWHERAYIRVDWSSSQVDARTFSGASGAVEYKSVYFVQPHEKSPDALRVEDASGHKIDFESLATLRDNPENTDWSKKADYFDVVGKFQLEPEYVDYEYSDGTKARIPLCYFIQYGGKNYQTSTCGPTEVKVRTAFLKVGERNYEPVTLSDREMGKFGYFRTERFTWDRKYGITETGRIYLANLHNIWQQAYQTDADGKIKLDKDGVALKIPVVDRVPRPITYHLNEDFPCELIATAQKIAAGYNDSFRRTVAVAKGLLTSTKGDLEKELLGLPTSSAEAKAKGLRANQYVPKQMFKLGLNGWSQTVAGSDWSCDNLTLDKSKVYARLGDLRYNFMAWVNKRQIVGPLGYGPSSADPETGEIIAGMAHIYGSALDEYAGRSLEIVRMLNNDLTLDNVVSGDYIKNYIANNKVKIDPAKIPAEVAQLRGKQVLDLFVNSKLKNKLAAIRQSGIQTLALKSGSTRKLQQLKGTGLEDYLINEEIIKGLAPKLFNGQAVGPNTTLDSKTRQQLLPTNWMLSMDDAVGLNRLRWDRAAKKSIWLAEFADDSIQGLALELWKKHGKTKDYNAIWQEIRELIFRGTMEHEIGHTLGLRHNFAGSYDSMNYFNRYWDLRAKADAQGNGGLKVRDPVTTSGALTFSELYSQAKITDEQVKNRMREYQYSSIMDYHSKFNSDAHGLGKYDNAALLFAYGGAVEVFDKPSNNAKVILRQRYSDCDPRFESTPNVAFSPLLEQWHYSSVWNLLGKSEGLETRRYRKWSEIQKQQTDATSACAKQVEAGTSTVRDFNQQDVSRDLEVPYMFCSDEVVGATVSCQRWDEGADPMEQTDQVVNAYKNYYFFNNFKRDRFGFNAYSVYSRVAGRYFSYLPNIYQHWLFRVGFFGVDDPTLGNYWTIGTWKGFNTLMDVIATPEYGTYCLADETKTCNANGDRYLLVSNSTAKTSEANRLVVGRGQGRRRYSAYDFDSGYYYQYQTKEAGHFWEYLAAVEMLTASSGTFVGVEIASDFTRYLVPYFIMFEDELTSLFEDVVADDYKRYAPRLLDGTIHMQPGAVISLTNGDKLDPFTGQKVDSSATPKGVMFDLNNNFTLKFYTLANGMSEFRRLYSLHYADRQQVFRVGSGEEVTPGPGRTVLTCKDPITGHVYGTLYDATVKEGKQPGAVKLIKKCQSEVQSYENLQKTAPDTTPFYRARNNLNSTIEWMNFMRGLYAVYGSNY